MISICNDNDEYFDWWENFAEAVRQRLESLPDLDTGMQTWIMTRNEMLSEWKSILIKSDDAAPAVLHFESEEDMTLFLLKWS